ncbi:DNA-formamidopyrimidine glycosylase family protein [Burkholderia sp. RS01]|uniref:DNA-formamidopyrimidine glycosylase family protein n=1 Tax=unclassified Burkholderia TaxID=2613784 RepID=UPI00098ECE06
MPEGHSIHRLARQFGDVFAGEQLAVTSPQGRFAAGAALLDGRTLMCADAHGKHLFLRFDHGMVLHVHLGLYGAWDFGGDSEFRGASSIGAPRKVGEREVPDDAAPAAYAGPPAPVGAVRVRLAGKHGWADLRGATTCAAITEADADAVLARLGPDPLHNPGPLHMRDPRQEADPPPNGSGGRDDFVRRVLARRMPLASLLMDQKVIAGVGNVYRAEVLFRRRMDPWLPGSSLTAEAAGLLWDDTAAVMADGVRDGRIITTTAAFWSRSAPLPPAEDAHFVYRRHGQPCRVCGTPVALTEHAARKLYWCPSCQRAG